MKALGREFIADVEAECFRALGELGIKKRKKKIGTWDLNNGFHGWIGLNTSTRYGDETMNVNPFVGLRFDPIHRIIAEVEGVKYERYSPPTISQFLGHLSSTAPIMGFEFAKGGDIAKVAGQLCDCIQAAGLPYVEENASLRALVERIPIDCAWEDASERLLVATYLLGNVDEIRSLIAKRRREGRDKHVNIARFDEFSGRFLKYISTCK